MSIATPIPFLESDKISQTISTPNTIEETPFNTHDIPEIKSVNESEKGDASSKEEDSSFDKFFETMKDSAEDLHKVSGGVDEVIPSPNFGNLFDPQDEVMSRMFIGAAILAALRRNTLFSVSGPSAVLMAVFYPIIYLAMVFTDMFLFGNVKFAGE